MVGVTEALEFLKNELDILEVKTRYSLVGYTTVKVNGPYFRFKPLNAFLGSQEQFGLSADTRELVYSTYSDDKFDGLDRLEIGRFMLEQRPMEWAELLNTHSEILNSKEKIIVPYQDRARKIRYHWYDKDGTFKARIKIKEEVESELVTLKNRANHMTSLLPQKVELGEKAFIDIHVRQGGLNIEPISYVVREYVPKVSEPKWNIRSKLSAEMPCQIDESHPLVTGISNNLDSVELKVPSDHPEILVIIKESGTEPNYKFLLKDSGIDMQNLKTVEKLMIV